MHFSLLEKFGAAALICAWLVFGTNFLGNKLVPLPSSGEHGEQEGGHAAMASKSPGASPAAAPAPPADLGTLLAAATSEQGEKIFGKCKACHSIEQGGPNKVGPNLFNVVGGPKAHMEGFAYSSGLAGMHGQTWTYEDLNTFLTSPKDFISGTKMTFAGLKDPVERAEVITFLRANTQNPPPLPEPKPAVQQASAAAPAAATTAAAEAPAAAAPAEEPKDVAALVAAADPAIGEKIFGKCKACHDATKGGPNKVGPNLWGIVGAKQAHRDDFSYSSAISGLGGTWTVEKLFAFLDNPRQFAPGTKMTFVGLAKPAERADVIAYLERQSDTPPK